jgi:hypothetical protein
MITCDFNGRLGNNLFQIATVISLAKKHNTDFIFPLNTWAGHRGKLPVDLSIFNYNFSRGDIEIENGYEEKNFHYDPIEINNINFKISGFFQSWKYFNDIKEDLLNKYFIPNNNILENLKKYTITDNSLGISVRRGDYLMLQENHCVLSSDYYQNAINKYFQNNIDSIYIFSDDLEWCQNIFGSNCIYINEDVGTQLFLMTKIKHLIMSNSTFSWWGAYLNCKNGTIISPNPWFGPNYKNKNTKDLYYLDWVIIEHEIQKQVFSFTKNMFD